MQDGRPAPSPRGRVRSRRGVAWDEQSIREALTEFLVGWDVWPTCEQFANGGAKGLRDALARFGGAQRWAQEMGLPGGDRPRGGIQKWTEETIRQTLARFLGDRDTWPTRREFDEAGLHAFYEALQHHGGVEHWANEMGVVRRFQRPPHFRRRGAAQDPAQAIRWG